jgi:hypothetical protein
VTPRAALSRRTALATAASASLALGACDIDPPRDDAPPGGASPTPDADSVLVGGVVAAIAAAQSVVEAALTAAPALAPTLDPLAATHAAHRELLAAAAPDAPTASPVDGGTTTDRASAVAAVRREERRLRRGVERASLAASSGDLARVLAVMAGALAQHEVALAATTRRRTAP